MQFGRPSSEKLLYTSPFEKEVRTITLASRQSARRATTDNSIPVYYRSTQDNHGLTVSGYSDCVVQSATFKPPRSSFLTEVLPYQDGDKDRR